MKKLCFIAVLSMIVWMLTGCMTMTYHITLDNKGNAKAEYEMIMEKQYYNMLQGSNGDIFSEIKKQAEDNNFIITDMETDTTVGFKAVGPAHENFKDIINKIGQNKVKDNVFDVKWGLFYDKYKLNSKIDLTGIVDSSNAQLLNDNVNIKFDITLPVAASLTNTDRVSDHTYEWNLQIDKNNEIVLEYTVIKWINIGITVALLVLIVSVIFNYTRKKRRLRIDK